MYKFKYIIKCIFEGRIEKKYRDLVIEELRKYDLLNDLLPYLLHHRLLGFFYVLLLDNNMIQYISKDFWRIVKKILIYEDLKAREYYSEAKLICRRMNDEKISYVFLKGIHLNSLLYFREYGYLWIRPFNDIDILVEKKNISKIDTILTEAKYCKGDYSPELNSIRKFTREEEITYMLTTHQAPQYIKETSYSRVFPGDALIIDVNFSIFQGGKIQDPIGISELFESMVTRVGFGAIEYYSLGLEYDLIQLIYHFYKDCFIYEIKKENNEQFILGSLIDIYRFIKKYKDDIDWYKMKNIIERAQIRNEILMILKILKMEDLV